MTAPLTPLTPEPLAARGVMLLPARAPCSHRAV